MGERGRQEEKKEKEGRRRRRKGGRKRKRRWRRKPFHRSLNIRLLEESAAGLKQNQDKLAAQLQVASEHKARLQKQVESSLDDQKALKEEYGSFRSNAKIAQDNLKAILKEKHKHEEELLIKIKNINELSSEAAVA